VTPGVDVQPQPGGGVIVTTSVTGNVPVGHGVVIQPHVEAPIVIPQSGPPQVAPSGDGRN
jgi:hypothetical protein